MMADLSHLEKMGRELKCPICLSLLKSAVSLGCNHVFCNACITELMKSASDCPVCKTQFRRREVRAAPHMDNLVTVFKSMEAAVGVNILTTQIGPSTKNPGDIEKNSDAEEATLEHKGRSRKKRPSGKKSQKSEKADAMSADSCQIAKPSFPAKKRIHVTPYPVAETPQSPIKVSKLASKGNELETTKLPNECKMIALDEQGDTSLSPFFWLREDDEDENGKASGEPSGQPTAYASQSNVAPCFSDIKDSEDDTSPIKLAPTSQFNAEEAFDSEMFEWTQRACSPELCSTPLKKQTAGRTKLDAFQEKDRLQQTQKMFNSKVNHDKPVECSKTDQETINDKKPRALLVKRGGTTNKKRLAKTTGKHPKKCSNIEHEAEILIDSAEEAKDSSKKDEDAEQREIPNCERRIKKRGKKSTKTCPNKNISDVAEAPLEVHAKSTERIQNEDADFMEILLPVLKSNTAEKIVELNMQEKTKKTRNQATLPNKKRMKLSMDNDTTKTPGEVPGNANDEANTHIQENQKTVNNQVFPSKHSENDEVVGNGSHRSRLEIQNKAVGESKGKRKRKIQAVKFAMDNNNSKVHVVLPENNGGKRNQSNGLAEKTLSSGKQISSNNGDILRKCGNLQIVCAFCQNSNNTEESGEMVHYFNGKPVAVDYNEGVNVIHSHKHCTEWAPDVYFEDDLAVNLAAELSRSKRIKCCCCGIKGAALGCYEKSCRKSFHFTCAKLIRECRWDNDNFVMLCPLHSSSKLPSESSKTLEQKRKKRTANIELKASNRKNNYDKIQNWIWPSGSPCKWVLCCSALTATEKDIISEFTTLTGVAISKAWSPAVTHVIASTDENGACKRTLKFLMGILEGKWILGIEWIKACLKAMKPVEEEKYEIAVDVHGIRGGPRLGRLRLIHKEPKLFDNFRFYLVGDFAASYKGYIQDLVAAAGGTVLHRKPLTMDQEKLFHNNTSLLETLVVYSVEMPGKQNRRAAGVSTRRVEAQALADVCGAKVAASSWIIDSIAASKLQPIN
ncbi:uncharacterized protein A4U43_C07F34490 [Asparagus officinalis]|uniref:RING-type E3 ubiquitin transferase BRCA1 n=1 Tax=Asparagus officinalis TaxID=4686 RepID=A0A5P1EGZ9_ASPOF|nr:protein BREAST CANCER SUSCEPTIBILITY 1 homolog [Asparagus officinalis]ONK65178.1 uncharacterized protein A4U43_C07F34490 [Asparagus officinalis]